MRWTPRHGLTRYGLALVGLALSLLAACQQDRPDRVDSFVPTPSTPSPSTPLPSTPPLTTPPVPTTTPPRTRPPEAAKGTYAFPVVGNSSYARIHHDYPATDIIAACGLTARSVTNGVVLEVSRVDTWTKEENLGSTRGGLFVSILGDDGVRYYMSHFSSINAGVEAGKRVKAGEAIAKVGRTGDAGACHVHFGISPPCKRVGDWAVRRGEVWPWSYLDAWRAGRMTSPAPAVTAWRNTHAC